MLLNRICGDLHQLFKLWFGDNRPEMFQQMRTVVVVVVVVGRRLS